MKSRLFIIALLLSASSLKAQYCDYISEKSKTFIDYARKAKKLVKDNPGNDTVIASVAAKLKILENELGAIKGDGYSAIPNFIDYNLTLSYSSYFSLLIQTHNDEAVLKCIAGNEPFFTFINKPGAAGCKVTRYVTETKTVRKIDEDGEEYSYTNDVTTPQVAGVYSVSEKDFLQNKAGLFTTIIMAARKQKKYEIIDKYFETAYRSNVWINTDGILPVSASKYALANYDADVIAVPATTLHAAITNILALELWNTQQPQIIPTASDTASHQLSVDILLKVGKTKLDATKIERIDLYKLIVTILRDKSISTEEKIAVLKSNFDFYTSYQLNGEYDPTECLFYYDIFDYIPNYVNDIWASKDKQLIESFIRFINEKKIVYLLDNHKQLLYDVYLYCRDNGYKSKGKEIYNATLGKYAKDRYPK